MAQAARLLTLEEFWELPDPQDGRKYELVRGEVVEGPPPGGTHNWIVGNIFSVLRTYATAQRLGAVFGDSMRYVLNSAPSTYRIADVSFVSLARVIRPFPKVWPFPPDLAVEVVSPDDGTREVDRKVDDYLAAGVHLVWVVWPESETVTVHALDAEAHDLTTTDTLDGGDVLPGFSVAVASLFAVDV